MAENSGIDFLHKTSQLSMSCKERAVALLWFKTIDNLTVGYRISELCNEIESAGYPKQNQSRLKDLLKKDKRTANGPKNTFKILISKRDELNKIYFPFLKSRKIPPSDSVVPLEIFLLTRGYLEKVVRQINASYDTGLYDCCAVMC